MRPVGLVQVGDTATRDPELNGAIEGLGLPEVVQDVLKQFVKLFNDALRSFDAVVVVVQCP